MTKYVLHRFLTAIPVILAVFTITFFLIRLAPGGPFDTEKSVPAEIEEQLKEQYNLNAPLYKQYLDCLIDMGKGDFGPSYRHPGRSVVELIGEGLPATAELGLYALLFALGMGVFSGVFAALKKNTVFDFIPMSFSMIGICIPSFLLGPLLVLIFGIYLEWVPVSGWGQFTGDKILPSITLGSAYAAYIARLARGGMLEILSQDYIRTARAKGLHDVTIIIKHALRGGLLPVVSFLGPAVAGLLAGSFATESIFQIPGIGRFYVQAAFNRDYTMILGTTMLLAVFIIAFNLLSDIVTVLLDPRLVWSTKNR